MKLRLLELHKIFSYFSIWADLQFLFTLFPWTGVSPVHRLYEMKKTLLCLCMASVGGAYITYIRPGQIYVSYLDHTFENTSIVMMDFLGHQLLLMYFVFVTMRPYRFMLGNVSTFSLYNFTLPVLYFMAGLPYQELYGLTTLDAILISGLSVAYYYTILKYYNSIYRLMNSLGKSSGRLYL